MQRRYFHEPRFSELKTITETTIHSRHVAGQRYESLRLERVNFDNCSATRCTFKQVEALACRLWSCTLHEPTLEDLLIRDVRMTVDGGPGKRDPFFIWGGVAKHVRLVGTIGGLIWNQPYRWLTSGRDRGALNAVRRYYASVDWALDVTQAEFQSGPALRFGPPGQLIRRDPVTQPLVTRHRALAIGWKSLGKEIGAWRGVLDDLITNDWPDSVVLIPAGRGRALREDLEGIERLRSIGVAE